MVTDNKKTARIAGVWYLADILILMFSYLFVDDKLLVSGDAAASLSNIKVDKPLFYIGCAAFFIGYICIAMSALMLMKLFKPIDSKQATFIPILLIIGVIIVFTGKAIEIYGAVTQNVDLLALRENIDMSAEIFWGLWLLPIGLLIFKSDLIPKIIGMLLLATCVVHFMDFTIFFFTPNTPEMVMSIAYIIGMFGEFGLVLWLLIKGVKTAKHNGPL